PPSVAHLQRFWCISFRTNGSFKESSPLRGRQCRARSSSGSAFPNDSIRRRCRDPNHCILRPLLATILAARFVMTVSEWVGENLEYGRKLVSSGIEGAQAGG